MLDVLLQGPGLLPDLNMHPGVLVLHIVSITFLVLNGKRNLHATGISDREGPTVKRHSEDHFL